MPERQRNEDGTYKASHGMSKTKIYSVWCQMRGRCERETDKSYARYGGVGISVCKEWSSFDAFYRWAIENGYREGLTIDRIDNKKGYRPENCRWATTAQQNRNYSRNRFLTYNGKTQCVKDWADEFGINHSTILFRLKQGKSVEAALSKLDGRTTRWRGTTLQNSTP